MAGPKGSKYFDIFLNYQVWLEKRSMAGQVSDDLVSLLRHIQTKGSLKAAANEMDISYRKAWGDLKDAEEFLGFQLCDTHRGGKDGGISVLTPHGQQLVAAFDELHQQMNTAIHAIVRDFFGKLNQADTGAE